MENTFSYDAASGAVHFWYAKGNSVMSGKEFHTYHEILFLLNAEGTLYTESEKYVLAPEMLILIPKETFHKFVFDDENSYTRCRIAVPETERLASLCSGCLQELCVFTSPSEAVKELFSQMRNAFSDEFSARYSAFERGLFLETVLIRLLLTLKGEKGAFMQPPSEHRRLLGRALAYIEQNYTEKIDVAAVAGALYVSRSTLSHVFAKELGVSVHHYITDKRLLKAHLLLLSGASAGEACAASGFGEYSSFFRLYKKRYGCKPSAYAKEDSRAKRSKSADCSKNALDFLHFLGV